MPWGTAKRICFRGAPFRQKTKFVLAGRQNQHAGRVRSPGVRCHANPELGAFTAAKSAAVAAKSAAVATKSAAVAAKSAAVATKSAAVATKSTAVATKPDAAPPLTT